MSQKILGVSRQFATFCAVGAISVVIDWGTTYLLTFHSSFPQTFAHSISKAAPILSETMAANWIAKACGVGLATVNGFYLNTRYTFRDVPSQPVAKRFSRFATVIVVGIALNATIVAVLLSILSSTSKASFWYAQAFGTIVTTFWNYFANKHWTYRVPVE